MTATVRPRRSVLYMPGANARALEKGKTLPCDGIIFDLEDATAPDAKTAARKQVVEMVKGGGYGGRELIIRVNGLNTPWGYDDLVAAAQSGAHTVLLPKVESADIVRQAEGILVGAGAPPELGLACMMETPRGILRAEEIADATPRLSLFVMGTSDLTKDLSARHTQQRLPMLPSLAICLLAARAAGIGIVDGVYLDLDDATGFEASCRQGLELGFDGKTLIHPKQIEPTNQVFAPSDAEVAQAKKIMEAFQAAQAQGKGVVLVDGKLIENLHVESAKRLVALAEAIGTLQS